MPSAYLRSMSIGLSPLSVGDHLQNLSENMIAERFVQIDCHTVPVIGCQAEADSDSVNFQALAVVVFLDHMFQVIVEVKLIIGEIGGAIHRAAVRDYHQYASPGVTVPQTAAGPFDGLAIEPLAKIGRF